MKKWGILACLLLIIAAHSSTQAAPRGTNVCVTNITPACGNWPGGTVQDTNFFVDAAQSGQTFVTRPSGLVAGVDFPVGLPPAYVGRLLDPVASPPTHCAISTVSGRLTMTCASVANLVIQGYDFGPNFGHDCVDIIVSTSATGSVTFADNNFKASANCLPPNTGFFTVSNLSSADVIVQFNTFDGQALALPSTAGIAALSINTKGNIIVRNNSFRNIPGRPILVNTGSNISSGYYGNNFFNGFVFNSIQGHGEIVINTLSGGATTIAQTAFDGNTVLQPSTECACGTAPLFLSTGTAGATFISVTADNNTLVSNYAGGITTGASITGSIIDDGTAGHGPGNILTVGTLTAGTIAVGQITSGTAYWITGNVSGSGSGSKWTVSNAITYTPSVTVSSFSATLRGQVTSQSFIEVSDDTFTSINLIGNYIGTTGALGVSSAAGVCTNPVVFIGNISLETGGALNSWTNNTSTGC